MTDTSALVRTVVPETLIVDLTDQLADPVEVLYVNTPSFLLDWGTTKAALRAFPEVPGRRVAAYANVV
jgi:hypothetical protein